MKLSIVIPAYNSASYIKKCVDSVLSVPLEKEVIIINDGSTDNTMEVLEEYQNIPNVLIVNQENRGVAYARNLGIKMAKGDYISFMDSDDFIDVQKYTSFVSQVGEKELVIGSANFVYHNVNEGDKIYYRSEALKNQGLVSGAEHFSVAEKTKCYFGSMCFYVFRRDFLLKNHLVCDEKVATYEDAIFMVQALALADKVQYFDEDFYYYRQNVSFSRSTTKKYGHIDALFAFMKVMVNIAQKCRKEKPYFALSLYSRALHILKKAKDFEKKNYHTKYLFNLPKYAVYNFKIKLLRRLTVTFSQR